MLKNIHPVLAVFVILFAIGLVSAQIGPATKLPARVEEYQLSNGRVPKGCPLGAKLETIKRDKSTGIKPSAVLSQFITNTFNNPQFPPRKNYGDKGPDRAFYDSFPVGGCRVCAVILTSQVGNEGGSNDSFNIYLSPATLPLGSPLHSFFSYMTMSAPTLWVNASETNKTISTSLNVSLINAYIINPANVNPMLDVYVQDDTRVDSIQVDIWRY